MKNNRHFLWVVQYEVNENVMLWFTKNVINKKLILFTTFASPNIPCHKLYSFVFFALSLLSFKSYIFSSAFSISPLLDCCTFSCAHTCLFLLLHTIELMWYLMSLLQLLANMKLRCNLTKMFLWAKQLKK